MIETIQETVATAWMNRVFYDGLITLTPWKIIGLVGALMFGGRWVVQIIASTFARRSVIPRTFWTMSLIGSLLALSYFVFGKNDSVGIIQNLPGCLVASYNLYLEIRFGRKMPIRGSLIISTATGSPDRGKTANRLPKEPLNNE